MSDAQRLSDCMDELAAMEKRMREVAEQLKWIANEQARDGRNRTARTLDKVAAKLLEGIEAE